MLFYIKFNAERTIKNLTLRAYPAITERTSLFVDYVQLTFFTPVSAHLLQPRLKGCQRDERENNCCDIKLSIRDIEVVRYGAIFADRVYEISMESNFNVTNYAKPNFKLDLRLHQKFRLYVEPYQKFYKWRYRILFCAY